MRWLRAPVPCIWTCRWRWSDSPGEAAAAFADALPVLASPAFKAARDTAVLDTIVQATAAVAAGDCLALVTNPIAKQSLQSAGLQQPGHTELLAVLAARHHAGRTFRPVMMLASSELKVVPTTVHMPLVRGAEGADQEPAHRDHPHHGGGAARRLRHRAARVWRWPASIRMPARAACIGREEVEHHRPGDCRACAPRDST